LEETSITFRLIGKTTRFGSIHNNKGVTMKFISWRTDNLAAAAALVLTFGAAQPLLASSPFGIYAIVDKVVFEPSETAPERIQIWGVFVVPAPMSTSRHGAPQRGFLYYRTAPGREETTRKEWADLKTVAGTGQTIAFAQYWVPDPNDPNGNPHRSLEVRVHKSGVVASSDVYPLGIGIVKMRNEGQARNHEEANQRSILTQLKEAHNAQ
jgi:hypothetical protein